MAEASRQEIKLFYCYAHEDRDLRDQFEKSLSGLKRHYRLGNWYDREILAGQDWEQAIAEQLNSADIIFLLISNDFMASDYCYGVEMQRALERHREGSCLVLPILLRPTHWEGELFGKLQLLPTDARPITRWPDRDDAFRDVVREVSRAIKALPIHKTKEEWLEEGHTYYKANRFREALTTYNQVIKLDSTNALAHHHRGEASYRLNNFLDALADFEKAASLDPILICVYTWKGDALSRLKQNRKAIIAYAKGLTVAEKTPQDQWNAQFHYYRGDAFYGLNFYAEALIDYEQAIHLDPDYAFAYNSKGMALYNLKCYEEALSAFDQAIRLDPDNALAYHGKGATFNELKCYEEALSAFDQAIRLDPDNALIYLDKRAVLYSCKRYEEALSTHDQIIRLNPNNDAAYRDKGIALYNLNRYEEALSAFDQIIRLNPNDDAAYRSKGAALYAIGKTKEAQQALDTAQKLGDIGQIVNETVSPHDLGYAEGVL